jgi:lipopolysaccharide/colanic/teichoic acid biosynthesis glycosyltransferase
VPTPERRVYSLERYRAQVAHADCLGLVLLKQGLIDREDLESALQEQAEEARRGHWVLLGELLQRWQLVSPEQIASAISLQTRAAARKHFTGRPHRAARSAVKRAVDIAGALVGLGLTAAVFPAIATAITLEDAGPILFRQTRVGLRGRQFGILKFRTMVPDADVRKLSVQSQSQRFFKATTDARITRVGQVLRKSLLDELPQFWNVLVGEMSLVGTRPPTLDEVWHYEDRHWARLEVKAGMTGLWQITPDRHALSFEEVVTLDRHYDEHWSLALDALVLGKTILAVFEKVRRA